MKACAALVASALLALASIQPADAVRAYLKELPNGDAAFEQALGHVGTTSEPNAFGQLYAKSGKWDDALCKAKFPGTDMTVGEAFGDPCCTWKKNGTPDFKVEPFTTAPKKTECAANKPAATSAAPAATSAAPAAPATPAASQDKGKPTTQAPAGKPTTPAAGGNSTTPAPAGKPSGGKQPLPGSKCGVKKEAKSLEDDSEDDAEIDN